MRIGRRTLNVVAFWFLFLTAVPLNAQSDAAAFKSVSDFVGGIADRPRRVIYTPYPVSATYGVMHGFVHVTNGSVALARTDMVVDGALPIVFRRGYSSTRGTSEDFGSAGWRLTIDERIDRGASGTYLYRYGNGTTVTLSADGRIASDLERFLSDVSSVSIGSDGQVIVATRTGLTKRFRSVGTAYRIVAVADSYGNWLKFARRTDGRIERIDGSSGHWLKIDRDSAGRIRKITDSDSRTAYFELDGAGRLHEVFDLGGQPWTYSYDSSNRLRAAETPNGFTDVRFEYDSSGRVRAASTNDLTTSFSYTNGQTVADDPHGVRVTYAASHSGVTRQVNNGLGTVTSIEFGQNGLPTTLYKNGALSAQFSYRETGAVAKIVSADGERYEVRFDSLGRATSARGDEGGLVYSVSRYGPGLVPESIAYGDGSSESVQYSSSGELQRHTARNRRVLDFQRQGRTWSIRSSSGKFALLELNNVGSLERLSVNNASQVRFEYNDLGLREALQTSWGGISQYQYTSSGSLFRVGAGHIEEGLADYTYVFGEGQRVKSVISSAGDRDDLTYDETGLLKELRSSDQGTLRLDYDGFGRLEYAEWVGSAPLRYQYGPGEPDIVAQQTVRALPVFNQQREPSDFASSFDVGLTRIRPSNLGILVFDDLWRELRFAADPTKWQPAVYLNQSIAALRLDALLGESGSDVEAFVHPTNRLFVPREYWSINCCTCPCNGACP